MRPDPGELLSERTSTTDALIQTLAAKYLTPALGMPFSLLAVGGYGRRELFPQSDIDIVMLLEAEPDLAPMNEPLSLFLQELWDHELRASQSVRTVSECCRLQEQNIELHISLLDLRYVAGDPAPCQQLTQRLPGFYKKHELKIARELAELARKRHSKFNDTVYHLEPNIKEAPGGIRDIHLLHWFARLFEEKGAIQEASKEHAPDGLGIKLSAETYSEFLSPLAARSRALCALGEIEDSRQFLYAVRCFLHQRTQRDNNLLSFELQDRLAETWSETPGDPSEWMQTYYRHARRVFQSALKALEFAELKATPLARPFRDRQGRLSTSEFSVAHERVLLRKPAATLSSAAAVLRLFTFLARHQLHLSWDSQRRLSAHREVLALLFRAEQIPWSSWSEFFSQPHVALALREMQETGVLVAAIPQWQSVECLVVRDFYHRYTVDEHSIVAVDVIDRLAARTSDLPVRMRALLEAEDHVPILRLALLLHDIGKGTLPGDHVRGSLEVSTAVLNHLGVPEHGQDIVRFLIEHHLDLSLVMTARDLDDPATARFLTSRIPTSEDLRRLTLLTFADISAVNPTAMTPWRLEQLWRVYQSGQEQLARELMADRIDRDATAILGADTSSGLLDFLRGFPTRYLRTHTLTEIQHHYDLEQRRSPDGVAVEVTHESGVYLLTVLAADHPGQFARLCGALASCGMNILKAEAASNSSGSILDLIRFSDPMRTLDLNPSEIGTLERTIRSVLDGTLKVVDLLKRRRAAPRPSSGAKISPAFRFNNDASDECTLIDFVGEDRPGLLYDLTSAISAAGCNIELVLVDTEAHKAMDVFYLTNAGGKLDVQKQSALGQSLMKAASVN